MKDNIYDLLNDVHMDLNEYEDLDLSNKEKDKFKKNFNKSINRGKVKNRNPLQVAVAAALVLTLSVGFINEDVRASVANTLESVNYSIGQALGLDNGQRGYELDQAVVIGDYEFKITDLLMDENSLTLNYLVKGNEDAEEAHSNILIEDVLLRVNGKTVRIGGAHGGSGPIKDDIESSVQTYEFSKPIKLENRNEITLKIKGLTNNNNLKIKDTAEFAFVASKDELLAGAKDIEINKEISTEKGTISLERLILHPVMSKLYFSLSEEMHLEDKGIEAEILTEAGGKLSFSGGSSALNKDTGRIEYGLYSDGMEAGEVNPGDIVQIHLYEFEYGGKYHETLTQLGGPVEIKRPEDN